MLGGSSLSGIESAGLFPFFSCGPVHAAATGQCLQIRKKKKLCGILCMCAGLSAKCWTGFSLVTCICCCGQAVVV